MEYVWLYCWFSVLASAVLTCWATIHAEMGFTKEDMFLTVVLLVYMFIMWPFAIKELIEHYLWNRIKD